MAGAGPARLALAACGRARSPPPWPAQPAATLLGWSGAEGGVAGRQAVKAAAPRTTTATASMCIWRAAFACEGAPPASRSSSNPPSNTRSPQAPGSLAPVSRGGGRAGPPARRRSGSLRLAPPVTAAVKSRCRASRKQPVRLLPQQLQLAQPPDELRLWAVGVGPSRAVAGGACRRRGH